MQTIFQYKTFRGRPAPLITVGVRLEEKWYPVEVYVDSGAAYSILRAQIAEGVGFDYRKGEVIFAQVGDGSFIPVYLHDIEIQLGVKQFVGKVGFSEKLGVGFNLLGRMSIFEQFTICFMENDRVISFEWSDVRT